MKWLKPVAGNGKQGIDYHNNYGRSFTTYVTACYIVKIHGPIHC